MKITILVDDTPVAVVIHDEAVHAFSLAHRALVAAQEEAARVVELVEAAPAPAPEPAAPADAPAVS